MSFFLCCLSRVRQKSNPLSYLSYFYFYFPHHVYLRCCCYGDKKVYISLNVCTQARPTKALQWTLVLLLVLYFLTFLDEFRYINIKLAIKITDRKIIDGCTTQGYGDFVEPQFPAPPRPLYPHCGINSPGTGFGNPVSGRYVGGPRGEMIWIPPKIHKSGWM